MTHAYNIRQSSGLRLRSCLYDIVLIQSNYKGAVSPMSNHFAMMAFWGWRINTVLLRIHHIEKFQIEVTDLTKFYAVCYILHKCFYKGLLLCKSVNLDLSFIQGRLYILLITAEIRSAR